MANNITFPWMYVPDPTKGRPVFNGYLYFGVPDLDPEIEENQIVVVAFQEDGSEINIPQPVRTNAGGVPTYNGSSVRIGVSQDFSLKVLNSFESQVYYDPNIPFSSDGSDSFSFLSEDINVIDGQLDYSVSVVGLDVQGARIEIAKAASDTEGTLLIQGIDYNVTTATSIQLLRSYSGGVLRVSNISIVGEAPTIFSVGFTTDIISSGAYSSFPDGSILQTSYYSEQGDGGGARWRKTGVSGLALSQSPADLVDIKLTDANGHEYELENSERINVLQVGVKRNDSLFDSTLAFNAAFTQRNVYIPEGNYYISGCNIGQACLVQGSNANGTFLYPFSPGIMIEATGGGDYVQFEQIRFIHDRSFDVDGVVLNATLNNRWCHMDSVYFEGLKGSAIRVETNLVETTWYRLKVSKCGDSGKPAIWSKNPSTSGDNTNNIVIRDMHLYAPQGVGVRFESELNASPQPGIRTLRIENCLIHGGTSTGGTTPPFNADLVQIDNCTDPIIINNKFAQIASTFRGIVINNTIAAGGGINNRGGWIDDNMFLSTEANWNQMSFDYHDDLYVGENRTVSQNVDEHVRLGTNTNRTFLERQKGYIGGPINIVNNGTETRGYISNQNFIYGYNGNVTLSGVRGFNSATNTSGSENFAGGAVSSIVSLPNEEPDAAYEVILTPDNNVTAWVTSKTVTGFTINLSSGTNPSVDWMIMR